jgi:hypothetical protein
MSVILEEMSAFFNERAEKYANSKIMEVKNDSTRKSAGIS